jgi:hypothetical protein
MSTAPTPPVRFDVTPYRPDGGYTSGGSALLIGTSMLAGAVLGAVASAIARYIYLIGVFPVVIGMVLGGVNAWAVQRGRVRSPLLAGIAGFFGGCVAMFAMHYGEYLQFRWSLSREVTHLLHLTKGQERAAVQQFGLPPNEAAQFLSLARSYHSFTGYIDEFARDGVQIQKVGHGQQGPGQGMNLGYAGSYIYWGVEVLAVAGIAFVIARTTAAEPFCTACERWKAQRPLGALAPPAAEAIDAVQTGDLSRVRPLAPGEEASETVHVEAWVCGTCGAAAPVDVKLKHQFFNKKNQLAVRDAAFVTYPGAALPVLEALFPPAPETEPEPEPPPAAEPPGEAPAGA